MNGARKTKIPYRAYIPALSVAVASVALCALLCIGAHRRFCMGPHLQAVARFEFFAVPCLFLLVFFALCRWLFFRIEIFRREGVTERLAAESRRYRMLSESGQAMIRAAHETDLLKEVCEIIVNVGGYRMAWVGLVERDTVRTIRPVSWAGHEDGYFAAVGFRWSDDELGGSAAGRVAREGAVVVNRDTATDPRFGPWRQAALQRGYLSAIALPLRVDGLVIGVLELYASRKDLFDADEERLLAELASDVAYGIRTIRLRAAHIASEAELVRHRDHLEELVRERSKQIAELNRQMEFILGATRTGLDIIAADYAMRYIDPAWRKIYGDFHGKKCYDYFMGRHSPCPGCAIPRALATKQAVVSEETLAKEGHRPIQVTTIPFQDEAGGWCVAEVNVDIADRKKTEAALAEAEARLRAILNSTSDGIVLGDRETRRLFSPNETFCRMLGYSFAEVDGVLSVDDIHPPEALARTVRMFETLAEGATDFARGIEVKRRDGTFFLADINGFPVTVGGKRYVAGFFRDATDRQRLAESLKTAQTDYELLIRNMPGAVYKFRQDAAGVHSLPYASEQFAYLTGADPAACRDDAQPIFSLILPEDTPRFFETIRRSAASMGTWDCEFRVRHPQGVRWLYGRSTPVRCEDGSIVWTGILLDVTHLKAAEEELAAYHLRLEDMVKERTAEVVEKTEDLRRALQIKADFTDMVSHELRTPLGAIKEGISLVAEQTAGPLNEKQARMLEIVQRNVDRLARLINDVLDFQRLESGRIEFKMQSCDLNGIVEESARTMLSLTGRKGLDFFLELDDELPPVNCDRDRIIQVIENLLNNAIKFTDRGTLTIKTATADGAAVVSVCDTGKGMRRDQLSHIFKKFVQLERKPGGTGLGLTICEEIVKRHGGRIWAESEPGKGSVFSFTLPFAEKEKR